MHQSEKHGFIGIGMGIFELTSAGISAAILFAFIVALIFKPKG
jgi:stage V sporulation protein AE